HDGNKCGAGGRHGGVQKHGANQAPEDDGDGEYSANETEAEREVEIGGMGDGDGPLLGLGNVFNVARDPKTAKAVTLPRALGDGLAEFFPEGNAAGECAAIFFVSAA